MLIFVCVHRLMHAVASLEVVNDELTTVFFEKFACSAHLLHVRPADHCDMLFSGHDAQKMLDAAYTKHNVKDPRVLRLQLKDTSPTTRHREFDQD
jgi:hypothetical protein